MTGDGPDLIEKILNSKVVEKIYDDGVVEPVKETSKFATDLVKSIRYLIPVEFLAARQDIRTHKLKQRIEAAINQVPQQNRVLPPTSISVPIINSLNYHEDDNILVELFKNLLAKAMDKTRSSEAHPGFIVIISQLSPDEALLLYELKFNKFKFTRLLDLDNKLRKFSNVRMESNEFPVSKLIYSDNFDMYLEHLEKLDLILVSDKQSQAIWQDDANKKEQIGSRETYTIGFTKFGNLFRSACLPEKEGQ